MPFKDTPEGQTNYCKGCQEQCPICGYYCLGTVGTGCIEKQKHDCLIVPKKAISTCCKAPLRYIDDFLCCASCGKSTEPVEPTTDKREGWNDPRGRLMIVAGSPLFGTRDLEEAIDNLLSQAIEKAKEEERKKLRQKIVSRKVYVYPDMYDSKTSRSDVWAAAVKREREEVLKIIDKNNHEHKKT